MVTSTSRILLETKEREVKELSYINTCQKSLIEAILADAFKDISKLKPLNALMVFHVIIDINEPCQKKISLSKRLGIWEHVQFVRSILGHAYPQNRSMGNNEAFYEAVVRRERKPLGDEELKGCKNGIYRGMVYYFERGMKYYVENGVEVLSRVLQEPEGLLSLTSRNDNTALPITSAATKNYIISLAKEKILKLKEKINNKTFFPHSLSSSMNRYSLASLMGSITREEFRTMLTQESKKFAEWRKENVAQKAHAIFLLIQFNLNAILFINDKIKNKIYEINPAEENMIVEFFKDMEAVHQLLRTLDKVDTCFCFPKADFKSFMFSDETNVSRMIAKLNLVLLETKLAEGYYIAISETEDSFKFNFTLRNLSKYAYSMVMDWHKKATANQNHRVEALPLALSTAREDNDCDTAHRQVSPPHI
jgi:hypothetical protein